MKEIKKPTDLEIENFLVESNAIEGVYDKQSLKNAKTAWDFLFEQESLTLGVILKTHKILMKDTNLKPDEKGYFRKCRVWVGKREGMDYKSIVRTLLMRFCIETARKEPPPDWKALHVVYEQIHPFVDGNGRTGRMFMNWTRIKKCNLPLLVIKADERSDYYQWFNV